MHVSFVTKFYLFEFAFCLYKQIDNDLS